MKMSNRYGLNLVEGSDIVNPLVQDVPNYERIDEEMGKNADAGVPLATELLSGTVHALTRENPNASMFRFVATANFKTGDTFTVDGVQVTALLTTGEPLATGCYVINSNVLCCLVGTVLTMFCANSLSEIHAVDSDKLGGEDADYYASANSVVEAINLAQNANQISLNMQENMNEINDRITATLLWENYVAGEYLPQTLKIDLSEYSSVKVLFKQGTDYVFEEIPVGLTSVCTRLGLYNNKIYVYQRETVVNVDTVEFKNGCQGDNGGEYNTSANFNMVPVKIYGVKW